MSLCSLRHFPRFALGAAVLVSSLSLAAAGEEEEETTPSPVAIAISVMLLGSIGFIMILFYLTNHPDEDIKRYSWRVISSTISIFCAVLLFQAFNGCVEEFVLERLIEYLSFDKEIVEIGVGMVHCLIWLTLLQLTLAFVSGAVGDPPEGGIPAVKLNMKSWALLFAHISGFAAIHGFGTVQQSVLEESPAMALGAVPLAYMGLFSVFAIFDCIREKVAHADDGEFDDFEQLWCKETEDAENDVAGLSLSFLSTQVIRFYICDKLPNLEGLEPWEEETGHPAMQIVKLYVAGAVLGGSSLGIMQMSSRYHDFWHHKHWSKAIRASEILTSFFTFGYAWCFFYASKWAVGSIGVLKEMEETSLLMVVLAMFLSACSFTVIYFLDKMNDVHLFGEGKQADDAIEMIIMALGILVGFSWEQAFDVAVSILSRSGSGSTSPAAIKLVTSFLLVAVVFPAWRWYILPTEQALMELKQVHPDELHMQQYLRNLHDQHQALIMNKDTSEADLDLAHLKMKEGRRRAHSNSDPYKTGNGKAMKYLRVTSRGVEEIKPADNVPQLSVKDRLDLSEALLPSNAA